MWKNIREFIIKRKVVSVIVGVAVVIGAGVSIAVAIQPRELPTCDGIEITELCRDEDGTEYSKYLYHEATPETTKEVNHPATPAKTHTVNHPAVTGTRQVRGDCIRTSISYKSGSCALSQCRDGSYSGSTGRGTCSYHGGVAKSGGPWYTYTTETYIVKAAWTETVVDTPAKEAWTETVVDSPAKEAYTEKVLAE
jgi:hypothetical protein